MESFWCVSSSILIVTFGQEDIVISGFKQILKVYPKMTRPGQTDVLKEQTSESFNWNFVK